LAERAALWAFNSPVHPVGIHWRVGQESPRQPDSLG
jgi:hypothetical protein